ncbi:hypothetical protein BDP55DRAFT_552412 [Colletotrichum godetiae]|uniref:BCL5p n=1 Tax=Colletotrichum godetiae TaxID=1209918 RepID=A0AAJ0EVL5_9PEZI|nr:uncharacterized protein BDP55DRAFT_552412 [Colletotrichum godetiae]KAK1675428.1 hypothetical protein BDP55DRAFT_552412 [Colletotrichum godetiae]
MRMMIMSWSMCFHDVLDPAMLHASLSELLTIGNWKKLGGRSRLTKLGKLELHIPQSFTPSRPAIHFTTEPNPSSLTTHPLSSTIPSPSNHPIILDTPSTLTPLLAGPEAPKTFKDYTTTDRPLLTLHIITFSDATFVTITYPHSITDGMGRRDLVENWCRVLAGRRDLVTPLADPSFDPMANIAKTDTQRYDEPFLWEHKRLTGWGKVRFTLGLLWYLLTNRIHQRNIFIPATSLKRLRERAEADISPPADSEPTTTGRLSDGDILTAYLVRLACSHIPSSSPTKPISISTALDLRGRLHEDDLPPGEAHVSNLVAYNWTNTTASGLLHAPFGKAVALIRNSVRSQLTDAQVYASTRLTYNAVAESGSTNQFTEPNGFVVSVSNVGKARFHEVIDFSPAIVESKERPGGDASVEEEGERKTPRGMIVWQCNTPRMSLLPPCLIYIQGKDHGGNYLVQMVVSERTWRVIEDEVKRV